MNLEGLLREAAISIKALWKDRGFSTTAIMTLAVCLGANVAIFTIVNSVLLRPLPVPESERIVFISNQYPGAGVPEIWSVGVPDYLDRRRQMTNVFEADAMLRPEDQTVDVNGTPERMKGMRVTPSVFPLLKISPAIGHAFAEADGELGNEQKVILSYGLWQQLYGGNKEVVGKDLRINGRPKTIVGVMPRDFIFVDAKVRLWLPAAFNEREKSDDSRHSNNWSEIARLRPGATIPQAQAQVDAMNAANLERFPQFKQFLINAGFHTQVRWLQDVLVRNVKSMLYLLWAGAAFVLLIGGVNIANLALARANVRRKEIATKLALGGSRLQVARSLLVESVILAVAGGAAGLVFGAAVLRSLGAIGLDEIPRAAEIHFSWVVILFALATSVVAGILIGLVPVAHLYRVKLSTVLREETRTGTGGTRSRAMRRVLVVAQVGLACVLLIGAGLLLASFRKLLAVDPGFKSPGVITISTALPQVKYPPEKWGPFMNRTFEALRSLPGVRSAGATTSIPFGGGINKDVILAEGYRMSPGESVIAPIQVTVSAGYFETMETPLKRGRYFNERDTPDAPQVAIVDERLARKFWPGQDPIGKRMYQPGDDDLTKITDKTKFWTVVGVVADVQLVDLTGEEQPVGTYYFSLDQSPAPRFTLAIKTTMDPAVLTKTLRAEMAKIDSDIPVFDIRTLDERTQLSLRQRRAAMILGLAFATVALFLSAIGIYGVLTYLVTQRTREIGIRIALGSSAGSVFKLVIREGMLLVTIGLSLGLAVAVSLRTYFQTLIFGVRALEPSVISLVVSSLVMIALVACVLPAQRATRVDPATVLNS
jgi:putative ABC transport system permease protein